jgi:LVIVD repeat
MMMNNKLWKMNAATMLAFLSILATFCMAKEKSAQTETQRV